MSFIFRIISLICLLTLAGCFGGVTYPKEKIAESVEKLCLDEYNTQVQAKVVGQTLGVYLPLNQLLASMYGEFSFEEKAQEAIDHVMHTIRRVTLSTDADIKFFTIIGADKSLGIELVTTRYVEDLHRVILLNISLNDFVSRVMYEMGPSATILGEKRISAFFKSLSEHNIEKVIQKNFVDNISLENISPTVFINMLESGMKSKSSFQITNIRMKPIASNKIVYYVQAKEDFELKEDYTPESLSVPEDFDYRYLIVITTKNYNALIEKIYPLSTVNKKKEAVLLDMPEEFVALGDPEQWPEKDFFVEDIQLPNFIAFQTAQNIQKALTEQTTPEKSIPLTVEKVQANFVEEEERIQRGALPKRSVFELIFTMKEAANTEKSKKISKDLIQTSLKILKDICRNYNFDDYSGIRVLDAQKTEILNIDRSMIPTILGK